MASKKTRIILIGAAVVVLGAIVAFSATRDSRQRIVVQTGKVSRQDLTSVVSASGEVKPKKFVNVSANQSGRITQLLVKEGDRVRRGQVLARIEATRFEAGAEQSSAALQASRADLQRAQADLDGAKLAFERSRKMRDDELVSDQQFDEAEANFKMKQAQVDAQGRRVRQAEAFLASNRDELEKTVVIAPMDGVVTSLQREEGETVIGAQSFSPTMIMTIGDLSTFEVEVLVDETDIRYLELGQAAEVRVDALEGVKIKGKVTEIGSSAIPRGASGAAQQAAASTTTANQAKDFKITVTLDDAPPGLRSGLNATAEVTTAKKEKVLAVPIQAVVVREVNKEGKVMDPGALQASEGEPAGPRQKGEEKEGVFVSRGGEVVFTPVKTGIVGETDIEVVEGLKDGDEIVTGSYKTLRTLKEKAKIKVDKKKENS